MGRTFKISLFVVLVLTLVVRPELLVSATLTVESTPGDLPVLYEGENVGKTPHDINLPSGKHSLDIFNQSNRWESTISISGDAELTVSLSGEIPTAPHRALILSRPGDAQVKVDGTIRGRTPWSGELTPTEHTIQLEKDGYTAWEATVTPSSDFSLRGILRSTSEASAGSQSTQVVGASNPRQNESSGGQFSEVIGADVRSQADTEDEEDTPESQTQPESPEQSTKEPTTKQTKTEEDTSSTTDRKETAEEQPEQYPLQLESEPSGATVMIDGEEVGKTPFSRDSHPAGTISVKIKNPGFRTWSETLTLNSPTRLKVSLNSLKSTLKVSGEPTDMKLKLDNQSVTLGGSRTFEVRPGTYRVGANASGFEPYDTEVNLQANQTRKLTISLKRDPHVWEYSSTRDVFMELAMNSLGELVDDFGIGAGSRVKIQPDKRDWSHELLADVLSVVMNQQAVIAVDDQFASSRLIPENRRRTSDTTSQATKKLDTILNFTVVEMDVNYEAVGRKYQLNWMKRHFNMKLLVKLIEPQTGEIKFAEYYTRSTADRIPSRFKRSLRKPYQPPALEPSPNQ